ncbi:MAG: Coenzyme F420 hydrogenase/dehydrogenase, beta subunit C-terminal domain [Dehalococcoidia bacterium]
MDSCPVTESRCCQFCPRMGVDLDLVSGTLFGVAYSSEPIGEVREVLIARSREPEIRERAQYGGAVSTLIRTALQSGLISTAVLAKLVDGIPQGITVSSAKEVLDCCGSSYLVCPVLEAFHTWQPEDNDRVGVVGTPCQTLALAHIRTCSLWPQSNVSRLNLVIGLFCTWALSHSFRKVLAKWAPLSLIKKTDIPPPPANVFNVYTADRCQSIPLDDVRSYIPPACALCWDMTSEMADISVGAAEGIEGWNTVIIRTEKGQELVRTAVSEGLLETGELPKASFDHLVESARLKKRQALQNLVQQSAETEALPYLKLKRETVEQILSTT